VGLYFIYNENSEKLQLLAAIIAMGIFVEFSKKLALWVGLPLSRFVHARGMTPRAKHPLATAKLAKKWSEQFWQLSVHVCMTALEVYVLWGETWWSDPVSMWTAPPQPAPKQSLKVLYLLQLGVWVYTCIQHRFLDERRKDYFVMYVHHVVTIALIAGSAAGGFYRVGMVVLIAHDSSDIFLDLLKLSNLLQLDGASGMYIVECTFATTMATWFWMRNYEFPVRVIYKGAFLGPQLVSDHDYNANGMSWDPSAVPNWIYMFPLLIVLAVLHVYWAFLLVMVLVRIIRDGNREASRQLYEGDSENEEEAHTD
jgi:ceramide synthetase